MKRYLCDICQSEMPKTYERSAQKPNGITALCHVDDVCDSCRRIGARIPVPQILLERWREMVDEQAAVETENAAAGQNKFAGRCSTEKSSIYERLIAYRGNPPRLGCWQALAEASGGRVSADELRQITTEGMSPTIDVWRSIGKALDKLEGAG